MNEKVQVAQLQNISETLLIPLWARAVESERTDAIVRDEKAKEMVSAIAYDFSLFEKSWLSQVGVSIRTKILDDETRKFIDDHREPVIINIGAGLDTRFERLDDGRVRWYDLDLSETIEIRRNFFKETERYRMISGSVFDYSWVNKVAEVQGQVLIIAEGILMYFYEQDIRSLFNVLADRFPDAVMLFEMLAPFLVGKAKRHEAVKKVPGAEFRWSMKNARGMESWHAGITVEKEWNYFDFYPKRWGWMRFPARIPVFRRMMNNRIVRLSFGRS
ncbi:MAG TPA: class I SAM-dependent methyltransferase [Spirochaetota bacterium]|nr:class I SAM-dependent methyltransferase [Spirochaetota bacterium]HQP47876.1 class I SAM-dependent methyltransferase [Spirochaetota bacterium]